MRKRLKTMFGAAAALAALALGGSAIASAGNGTHANAGKHAVASSAESTAPDTDTIQSGDQTSPDTTATAASSAAASESNETSSPESSETSPSDGPGGHEDPSGDVEYQSEAAE